MWKSSLLLQKCSSQMRTPSESFVPAKFRFRPARVKLVHVLKRAPESSAGEQSAGLVLAFLSPCPIKWGVTLDSSLWTLPALSQSLGHVFCLSLTLWLMILVGNDMAASFTYIWPLLCKACAPPSCCHWAIQAHHTISRLTEKQFFPAIKRNLLISGTLLLTICRKPCTFKKCKYWHSAVFLCNLI